MHAPIAPSTLEGRHSVLLTASNANRARDALLATLAGDDGVVLLLATDDADDAVDRLVDGGTSTEELGVVDASGDCTVTSGVAEVGCVDGPGDLSDLGVETSERLERLARRSDRTVVGLDSVGALLTRRDISAVFRFLHVLSGRTRTDDAAFVAGIDRSAHDRETLSTIAELFDEVVPCSDGESAASE